MKEGKHVILCVDDDPDILDTLRIILESNGYAMVCGRTAEEGLKQYRAESPDLVLVDLMMEEVDAGTSLVTKLKAQGNTATVYMLSAVGQELSRSIDPSQLGLSGVFHKPIDADVVLKTLRMQLKKKP